MSAPFFTHMANRYRSPQNINSQSSSYRKRPHPGFQWGPHTHFRPMNNSTTENNDEHWCETCDRGFPTAEILEKHKQQHQKCSIDGCQFVAHPKVITRHIQMQHASGLYKKISKLNNPEEIKKWREERKKKYPTIANIEKKAAEYEEKVKRGEKMALKQSRSKVAKSTDQPAARDSFNKNNENHRTNKSNINQQKIRIKNDQPPPKKVPKITPKVPSVVEKNKLKPFTGILSISMDDDDTAEDVCNLINPDNSLIEEDEYNEDHIEQPIAKPVQEPVLCGALSSLMCDYGSSDEDNENDNKTTNVAKPLPPQKIERLHKNVETINNNDTNNHMVTVNSNIKEDLDNVTTNNLKNNLDQTIKNQDDSDNDSGPEEVKIDKMNITEPPCTSSTTSLEISKTKRVPFNAKKGFLSRNGHRQHNSYKQKVPSTLLQKLLYKEIRQERNIVLQCIRYIKQMNYFDKPNK
ncbi:unnamed protein product [Arctia plantaginis]|uniref:C2H2-type domain-containing protein n=1 Tax=Arctia plantaginis TaxID=874455 RepID=A0A8S0ZDW4_ARCPL|nr:unnamed protein product [Arctia plantaginis]